MDTEIHERSEHVLTLRQHLDLTQTICVISGKFPVAHSAPLKYNCFYHRSHTDQLFFHLHLKPSSRAAKTHLIQNLM